MPGLINRANNLIIQRVILTLFFCLFTTLAFAATVIKVRVTDSQNNPISHTEVKLVNLLGKIKRSCLTNNNGICEIKGLSFPKLGGPYYLKVSRDGYLSQRTSVRIFKNNKTYTFDFKLNPKILSISVNPKFWNIGSVSVNSVVTASQTNKITITNNGNTPETFELKLANSNWTASTSAGKETYVLSGLFCGSNDVPQAGDFNQDASSEDIITTQPKKATKTIFGYRRSAANGVAVSSGNSRSLYLQFKSPTITQRKEEQNISVIISCQVP